MRKPIHITKHGNAIVVSIPRPILKHLGLNVGDYVVCELTDVGFSYRRLTQRDLLPERIAQFLPLDSGSVRT